MILKLTVTLAGIKGFYRIYQVNGNTTLYTLHKKLQADLEFPQDQIILFKALGADGGVLARYGLFDLGSGTVDEVTLARTASAGTASFVYFYDVTNKKSVVITLDGPVEDVSVSVDRPVLIDAKGPEPAAFDNGYVAYEDLPEEQKHLPEDDDDLDDDEEDFDLEEEEDEDDTEDGEEIYDGSESL